MSTKLVIGSALSLSSSWGAYYYINSTGWYIPTSFTKVYHVDVVDPSGNGIIGMHAYDISVTNHTFSVYMYDAQSGRYSNTSFSAVIKGRWD